MYTSFRKSLLMLSASGRTGNDQGARALIHEVLIRSKLGSLILLLCLLAGLLFANASTSLAAQCAQPESLQEEFDRASAVFTGRVIDIEDPWADDVIQGSGDPIHYTFRVTKIWKGPQATALVVTSRRFEFSGGYPFALGQEYLVYAFGEASDLRAHFCSRTQPLDQASADLQYLIIYEQSAMTLPLYNWWNGKRKDNFLTSDPRWSMDPAEVRWRGEHLANGRQQEGYTMYRLEGYLPATPDLEPMVIELAPPVIDQQPIGVEIDWTHTIYLPYVRM